LSGLSSITQRVLPVVPSGVMPAATHHGASYSLLTLCARSADFRGSLNTRRDESYHDTSLSDIVQKVAARNKLNATQAAGLGTIKVSHIDQTQETDVAFITRLASLNTASNKEQSGITLGLTRSLRKQVFFVPAKWLPALCRHQRNRAVRGARFARAEDFRQQKTR